MLHKEHVKTACGPFCFVRVLSRWRDFKAENSLKL